MDKIRGGIDIYQNKEPAFSREQRRFLRPDVLYLPISPEKNPGDEVKSNFIDNTVFLGEYVFSYPGVEYANFGRFKLRTSSEIELTEIINGNYKTNIALHIPSLTIDMLIDISKKAYIIDETDGIPLYKKIEIIKNEKPNVILGDAIDDEPFISSGISTLLKREKEVAEALNILHNASEAKEKYFVTFNNIHDAKTTIPSHLSDIEILRIYDKYPVRARKELILKNTRFKTKGISFTKIEGTFILIGVQALLHLYRALFFGKKQRTTILTVAGDCVGYACNIEVILGTSIREVLESCSVIDNPQRVIMGGSMTGDAIDDLDIPVLHTTKSILAFRKKADTRKLPCINCGSCIDVCPVSLIPEYIYKYNKVNETENYKKLNVTKCIECGCCSYVCPSKLELSSTIVEIKNQLLNARSGE